MYINGITGSIYIKVMMAYDKGNSVETFIWKVDKYDAYLCLEWLIEYILPTNGIFISPWYFSVSGGGCDFLVYLDWYTHKSTPTEWIVTLNHTVV